MKRISQTELSNLIYRVVEEAMSKTGTWSLARCNEIRKYAFVMSDDQLRLFLETILGILTLDDDEINEQEIQIDDRIDRFPKMAEKNAADTTSPMSTSSLGQKISPENSSDNIHFNEQNQTNLINTESYKLLLKSIHPGCRYKLAQLCSLLHNYKILCVDNFFKQHSNDLEKAIKIAVNEKESFISLGTATAKLLACIKNDQPDKQPMIEKNENFASVHRRSSASNILLMTKQLVPPVQDSKSSSKTPEPGSFSKFNFEPF